MRETETAPYHLCTSGSSEEPRVRWPACVLTVDIHLEPMIDQTAEQSRILVVDDEAVILEVLDQGMTFAGYLVVTATNGADALALAEAASAGSAPRLDLILLDVMLPDIDGFDVCRQLRAAGNWIPVIFLTARDADVDLIEGFHQGADDYVTKPFRLGEIVARAEAVLRRSASQTPPATLDTESGVGPNALVYADVVLDPDRHTVTRTGRAISLSPTEFRLLEYLMINAELVLPRHQIIDRVWGVDGDRDIDGTNLATYVSYLRKKLAMPDAPDLIITVYGLGYALRVA